MNNQRAIQQQVQHFRKELKLQEIEVTHLNWKVEIDWRIPGYEEESLMFILLIQV